MQIPDFFVNLQIVFACLEKVGDLGLCFLSFLVLRYLAESQSLNPNHQLPSTNPYDITANH